MTRTRLFSAWLGLALAMTFAAMGQQALGPAGFDLSLYTVDGGGGTLNAGSFSLTATLGQPDATAQAMLTGGTFQLAGGFWIGVNTCTADVSGHDGVVNIDDLLMVINNWGQPGPNPADFNGDNTVNVDDLLGIITAWGNCP